MILSSSAVHLDLPRLDLCSLSGACENDMSLARHLIHCGDTLLRGNGMQIMLIMGNTY